MTMPTTIAPTNFDAWLLKVDAAVQRKVGLSIHDLPDVCLADWYDDGISPAEAAALALEDAGWED